MQTRYRPGDRIPMSWEDYEALGEFRGEYVDGELVVSPEPTLRHQTITANVWRRVRDQLPPAVDAAIAWGFRPGGAEVEFAPDVMVFTKGEDKRLTASLPHLLVEVLSSDPSRDLVGKAAEYAAAGVRRYWVIDPEGPEIVEFHLPAGATSYVEVGRHAGSDPVTLDIEVCQVTLIPADLAR